MMYPTNQYMDPYYSHYRNHTPYPYYPPPGWEASNPHAMDSSYRPPSYGPWPYSAGMHHPHPSEFHCCCGHTYPPGYHSFRPPFPQELPPPHLYYHGPFPQHPNACPSYFAPPHPYPVGQTPNGYDKFKSHCCGCPNHACHGGERSNVKIEEEKPDGKPGSEQKDADSGSIIRQPNHQYPFIWLPSGNTEAKENGRRYELPPQLLNGWDPVGSNRAGDVKKQEQDNQEKQFQWPIVWMPPGYDEMKEKGKELKKVDETPKVSEEAPSPKIKIIPLSWFDNGHQDQKPVAKDGSGDHNDKSTVKCQPTEHRDGTALEGRHKTTPDLPRRANDESKPAKEMYKTIPVVPEKENDEKKVSRCRTIPVMTQKESDEKKPSMVEMKEVKEASNAEKEVGNAKTKHGESAKAKHSKLPPVCLRVDPLPRKKSGNGSSRSPSPPNRKDVDKTKKEVKEAQNQNLEAKQSDTKKEIAVSETKEKSKNEMKKEMGISNETRQAASVKQLKEEEVLTSEDNVKVRDGSINAVITNENEGARSLHEAEETTHEAEINNNQGEAEKVDARTCRTNLSEPDAAVCIQSAYRGYDVRRWQPLDKLRKIRDVHVQMQGVREQLQSLEASSKKPSEKEQVTISETIMNLLLKLDTIQGLHPSVREVRKSVARELVGLQEKFDTLCKKPSDEEGKPETAESVIQSADPISSIEASGEEKARQLDGAEPSSMESMELSAAVQHDVPKELSQVVDHTEQKHQVEESSATIIEKAPDEEGKASAQVEREGASQLDMMGHTASSSTDGKHQIEESNDVSKEVASEEVNVARQSEELEVPLVDILEQLHNAASSGDSSELKQSTTSPEQIARTVLGENSSTTATASMENGEATDKDGPIEGQAQNAAAVETPELQHEISLAEDQHEESSGLVVSLEGSSVSLKDAEPQEDDPTLSDSVMSNVDDQPEEARNIKMQEEVVDATQDSTIEPHATPEASLGDTECIACTESEKPVQAPMLEPVLESGSAPEQIVLEVPNDAVESDSSGKDNAAHVSHNNESTVDDLTGDSATIENPLESLLRKEPGLQQNHSSFAQEEDDTIAETIIPELDSCGLLCAREGAVTGYEMPEERALSECQTDVQEDGFCKDSVHADVEASHTDECNERPKEVPVSETGAYSTEADVQVSETEKCTETPQDAPAGTTGTSSAEEEADARKEDAAIQTEEKASKDVISTPATPDGLKDSDEKKLAEENQKLREMLQKLLASGNDQMGVISDLSEKVKMLERKLARKKPKVRVHKPARHPTAKVC